MELDQFMKEVAVNFIVFVMDLFFPYLAQRLDFARKKDLNKQLYTNAPKGAERFIDVLLEVGFKEPPPEFLLMHIESQQQKRFDFPARMLAYHCLIYVREIEGERVDSFSLSEFTAWQNKSPFSPLFQRGVGGFCLLSSVIIRFKIVLRKRIVRSVCYKAT